MDESSSCSPSQTHSLQRRLYEAFSRSQARQGGKLPPVTQKPIGEMTLTLEFADGETLTATASMPDLQRRPSHSSAP